ncbi:MAG: hypothetical protein FWF69_06835 [Firmicutes bacterium]|nr:hypothetical protein [Bacillota bacterium]
MTQAHRIRAARALFQNPTPLRRDCGTLCDAACCRPDEDGKGGMFLFPGEEALYDPCPGWASICNSRVSVRGRALRFLTCDGRCPRGDRPLACRIFPLSPYATAAGVNVDMDVRAWPVCPLMPSGMGGLAKEFVLAARAAAELLWEDADCQAYIRALTEQMRAYKRFL